MRRAGCGPIISVRALPGMAVAAGWGWTSTGWVGVALTLGGFAIWVVAYLTGRRLQTAP